MTETRRTEVIQIRLTPDEKEWIRAGARNAGLYVSSYVRKLLLAERTNVTRYTATVPDTTRNFRTSPARKERAAEAAAEQRMREVAGNEGTPTPVKVKPPYTVALDSAPPEAFPEAQIKDLAKRKFNHLPKRAAEAAAKKELGL